MAATTKPKTVRTSRSKMLLSEATPTSKLPPKSYPEGWRKYLLALELRASRVLALGIPGTGKTFSANTVGLMPGEEVYNIYVGDETAAYQFMGSPSLKAGNSEFEYGPALHAIHKGCRLVINEIDHASADALDALIGVCDDPQSIKITLPDGSIIRPKEGFHVVATMNGQLEDLPEALRDRFEGCAININEPHPAAIEALPVEMQMIARKLTREACPTNQRVSIRQFRGFAELVQRGMPEDMAAGCAFQGRAKDLLAALQLVKVKEEQAGKEA